MSEVILYLADKLVDFLLAVLLIVIGYYINKWLDRRKWLKTFLEAIRLTQTSVSVSSYFLTPFYFDYRRMSNEIKTYFSFVHYGFVHVFFNLGKKRTSLMAWLYACNFYRNVVWQFYLFYSKRYKKRAGGSKWKKNAIEDISRAFPIQTAEERRQD